MVISFRSTFKEPSKREALYDHNLALKNLSIRATGKFFVVNLIAKIIRQSIFLTMPTNYLESR